MLKKLLVTAAVTLLLAPSFHAQKSQADSLQRLLEKSSGKRKVELYIQLSDLYQYIDSRKSIEYCYDGLELAKRLNYKRGIANLYSGLGYHYTYVDEQKALEYSFLGLKLRQELGDLSEISSSYNNLGMLFYFQGQYRKAIDYLLKSLKVREDNHYLEAIGSTSNNIALVYIALQSYDQALAYLERSLKIFIELKDDAGIALLKDNIGDVYRKTGRYETALSYFRDALALNEKLGNTKMIAYSLGNIGKALSGLGKFTEAIQYYQRSLELYSSLNDKNGIAVIQNSIARIYQNLGNYKKAVEHSKEALKNSEEVGSVEGIATAAELLSNSYGSLGMYHLAYENLLRNKTALDSLHNLEKVKSLVKMEMQYNFDKIKKEKETELQKERMYNNMLIMLICSFVIFTGLIYRQYRLKRDTSQKQKELNDKLQELNATKDKLFSIIAHDLRNPFNGIFNSAKLLTESGPDDDPEENRLLLSVILKSAEAGYELLENLLLWARSQTENLPAEIVNFDLYKIVNDNIALSEINARSKDICIVSSVQPATMVSADVMMVSTVVRNLLSNALKYSFPGGDVVISAEESDEYISVSVTDKGIGITEANLQNIFNKHQFNSTAGTLQEKGTGLGLHLCKDFITANGGSISVSSKIAAGTTFIFTLPKGQRVSDILSI